MAEFLSETWFVDLTARAAAAQPPPDLVLTIEQRIEGAPEGRWQVQIAEGSVAIVRPGSQDADVRIVTDRETAAGIQRGEISAQRAFLDGRLQIGGDVQALLTHREALTELGIGLA